MKILQLLLALVLCCAVCVFAGIATADSTGGEKKEVKMVKTLFDKYVSLIESYKIKRGMSFVELKKIAGTDLVDMNNGTAYIRLSRWDIADDIQAPPVWHLEFKFNEKAIMTSYVIHIPAGK